MIHPTFQDDQVRQREEAASTAPTQEAIPEELAEGTNGGVTVGQVFMIIGAILLVIAFVGLCILSKFCGCKCISLFIMIHFQLRDKTL